MYYPAMTVHWITIPYDRDVRCGCQQTAIITSVTYSFAGLVPRRLDACAARFLQGRVEHDFNFLLISVVLEYSVASRSYTVTQKAVFPIAVMY